MKRESAKVRECESGALVRSPGWGAPPSAFVLRQPLPPFHAEVAEKTERTQRASLAPGARNLGFTLVELMVVLVVLGIMAAVTGLAIRSLDDTDPASERAAAIADARRRALDTRRPVELVLASGDSMLRLLALPDGSVRGDTALGLNPLTGRPNARR